MKTPSDHTIRRLCALSGNLCAIPGCQLPVFEASGTVTGEVCHIKAKSPGGPRYDPAQSDADRHGFANLILLCRHHHKVIDTEPEIWSVDRLLAIKAIREGIFSGADEQGYSAPAKLLLNQYKAAHAVAAVQNIAIASPGAIQGKTIKITTGGKPPIIAPPPGTIGSDQNMTRYVSHLIKRYNEFASKEPTRKTTFSYGAISNNIQSTFGAKWQILSTEQFDGVSKYLQDRINKTRIAKINKGKGLTIHQFLLTKVAAVAAR